MLVYANEFLDELNKRITAESLYRWLVGKTCDEIDGTTNW